MLGLASLFLLESEVLYRLHSTASLRDFSAVESMQSPLDLEVRKK
ncbi:hypothetical protein BH23PLA1_BH23PLA1_02300 [soil metagenome]